MFCGLLVNRVVVDAELDLEVDPLSDGEGVSRASGNSLKAAISSRLLR
jgi:hypothetical protein